MFKMVGNLKNPQDLINKLIEENNQLKKENKELRNQLSECNTYSDSIELEEKFMKTDDWNNLVDLYSKEYNFEVQ